ncbi:hypothetical protein AB0383_20050 [Amycolatopsis sp. NPDC051373]|uniref:hypothetical protein n=1 Tax=Amycolatopsis sp. NPDC051373 TaxID=3155801 RepID=UPI003450F481
MAAKPNVSTDAPTYMVMPIDAGGITIPRALAWAILTAVVTTTLAVLAYALKMSVQVVIIATGLAVVAGCSILAAVVILCCRGAINALRRELRQARIDNEERQVEIRLELIQTAEQFAAQTDNLLKSIRRIVKDVRVDFTNQIDQHRAALSREITDVRVHQGALIAEALSAQPQQRRRLNPVD